VLAAVLAALFIGDLRPTRLMRLASFDAYQYRLPRARVSAPAVIVEIDEASLARHGQWPWPRTLLAKLVARVAAAEPAAIGIDILMPEPDRLSPGALPDLVPGLDPDLVRRLRDVPSNDAILGSAIRGRPIVIGVAGLEGPAAGGAPSTARLAPVRITGSDPAPFVTPFAALLRSVEEIDAAAQGHGLISVNVESGVVRRLPFIAAVGQTLVPGLGPEMLRVASGAPGLSVRAGRSGVIDVAIGDLVIPTERDGTVWLHYARSDSARFVSAADVLAGRVDASRFERKLVLIGVTAIGLSDYQATPVADRMPGVEIHAQLLEAIFDGDLLYRPPWARAAEAAAMAAAGLVLVWAVPRVRARVSALLLLGLVAAIIGAGVLLYLERRTLFDAVVPTLGLGALYTALLGMTLTEADSQRRALRRQVEQQRAAALRLAGELEAARRIQMGILPDPSLALAGERRVTLYAFLEPAREVGGDLYDFFRLDDNRVFFLIGDVSGKGMPGSLFMALSKSLCKSIALRRSGDVGHMLREANAEISRDNGEGLFVTVWAGILDARTGALEYANAGHDPPHLLFADGRAPARLDHGGGPPLCVVDDFPYEPMSWRLDPGDVLCLITDGVTEATNADGQFYGRRRLEDLLAQLGVGVDARGAGEAIRRDVGRFADGVEPSDDLAILSFEWTGPTPTPPDPRQ
jgi:adenylate cyclase